MRPLCAWRWTAAALICAAFAAPAAGSWSTTSTDPTQSIHSGPNDSTDYTVPGDPAGRHGGVLSGSPYGDAPVTTTVGAAVGTVTGRSGPSTSGAAGPGTGSSGSSSGSTTTGTGSNGGASTTGAGSGRSPMPTTPAPSTEGRSGDPAGDPPPDEMSPSDNWIGGRPGSAERSAASADLPGGGQAAGAPSSAGAAGDPSGDRELASPQLFAATMVGQDARAPIAGRASAARGSSPASRPLEAAAVSGLGRIVRLLSGGGAPPQAAVERNAFQPAGDAGLLVGLDDIERDLRLGRSDRALYARVIEEATRYLAYNPGNVRALVLRAEAYNHLKQYAKAEADSRKAVALDPGNGRAWLNLAQALYGQKRYAEALKSADNAVSLLGDAASYALRAYIEEALGLHDKALADFGRAAQLQPRYADRLAAARDGKPLRPFDETTLGDDGPVSSGSFPVWLLLAAVAGLIFAGTLAAVFWDGKASARRAPAAAERAPEAAPAAGLKAKYDLRRVIGRGGMGEVYEAVDRSLGRPVAVKRMSAAIAELGPQGRELFLKEARTVAALHHPAIVDIYEIIQDGAELYLVFEFVGGRTVAQLLAERGRLTLQDAEGILDPVCRALEFAHGRNLVHRDLKPANIMLSDQGFVKLMDFGIARSLSDAAPAPAAVGAPGRASLPLVARTIHVAGTPSYMALEAENGVVRKESDIYSLGVCLYEMLTGRLPFGPGASVEDKQAGRFEAAGARAGVPAAVDALLARALAADPDKRLSSAREFLALLRQAHG